MSNTGRWPFKKRFTLFLGIGALLYILALIAMFYPFFANFEARVEQARGQVGYGTRWER